MPDLLEDLVQLRREFSDVEYFSDDRMLVVTTPSIVLEGLDLGYFRIDLNIRSFGRRSRKKAYEIHTPDMRSAATYTAYNHGIILLTMLNWCRGRRLIRESPLDGYRLDKPCRRHHMAPTLAQVNALLAVAEEPIRTILAFTGMRVGELQHLRPQDLDCNGNWIHIVRREDWQTKTGESRKVPIHPRLQIYLQSLPCHKRPWAFAMSTNDDNANGWPVVDEGKLNDASKKLATSIGLPIGRKVGGFVTHSLRHFFLSHCLNARIPKYAVDYWAGHIGDQSVGKLYYGMTDDESEQLMSNVPFDQKVLPDNSPTNKENKSESHQ